MDTFTAIAEPTRRKILETLSQRRGAAAGDIYKMFSATPPAISQHLKVLREAGLVNVEKRGQQRIYYVNPEPIRELEVWIRGFARRAQAQFQKLDVILEELKMEDAAKEGAAEDENGK